MSLADIIAARKAAAATKPATVTDVPTSFEKVVEAMPVADIPPAMIKKADAEEIEMVAAIEAAVVPTGKSTSVGIGDTGKPLSFAEKMLLKKQEQTKPTSTPESASVPAVKNTEQPSVISEKIKDAGSSQIATMAFKKEPEEEVDLSSATPEDAQAYKDIKAKLDMLEDMAEANLKDAMSDLKKALLKNPQACYLILPQDIGQMVIALRKMKNEDVVTAVKEKGVKGPAKVKASKALTAEEIAAAFDDL